MRRGLASTRGEAQRLITEGLVLVSGRPGAKAATLVAPSEPIQLVPGRRWASRAAGKLIAALDAFDITISGRRALDVGASTGGFTDVLLDRGAESVCAVDVGYGQLVWRLAQDERVKVLDRTNFRTVDPALLEPPFGVVTVDVSFISVRLLADQLAAMGDTGTDYVVLVKPQFEVGRGGVGKGGIVRDPEAHRNSIITVVDGLRGADLGSVAVTASPVIGASGNREFLVHAQYGVPSKDLTDAIEMETV